LTPKSIWQGLCTYKGQKIEIDDTKLKVTGHADVNQGGTLPPGSYCASELFEIGGNNAPRVAAHRE
jgi:hypothetical protein